MATTPKAVTQELMILFDGYCSLCSGWVEFVSRRDRRTRFAFRALQGKEGQQILKDLGIDPSSRNSVVLVTREGAWFKSDAALIILRELGWPWRALAILYLVPRAIRDRIYDWIASMRYRLFARREVCRLS